MPLVSVVVPVHNPGAFLAPALESIGNQTLEDFEVVCLDDGSTDGSGDLLARWAERDPRFRVIRPGRVGLVEAANRVHAAARGRYVARFDSDDAMHPRRLELQAAFLDAHAEVDVVSCLVRHFPASSVGEGTRRYERWLNGLVSHEEITRDFLVELPVPNPSVMMRAAVHGAAGGFRDDGRPEDYGFWLRAWQQGCGFAKLPRVLHYWREHERRVTRTHPRYSVEAFLKAKVDALLRGPLRDGRPCLVWGAGMMGRRLTRLLVRADRAPLALLDIDPKKVGRTRSGRPILPPDAVALKDALVLGAVGSHGARARIRERLAASGLDETRDFWMVA